MKSGLQLFFILSLLCFFPAADTIAASATKSTEDTKMAAPLAEMLFYEAAEQAVEDGYAEIIPENPESKKPQDVADTKSKPAGEGSAPSEADSQNQQK